MVPKGEAGVACCLGWYRMEQCWRRQSMLQNPESRSGKDDEQRAKFHQGVIHAPIMVYQGEPTQIGLVVWVLERGEYKA